MFVNQWLATLETIKRRSVNQAQVEALAQLVIDWYNKAEGIMGFLYW